MVARTSKEVLQGLMGGLSTSHATPVAGRVKVATAVPVGRNVARRCGQQIHDPGWGGAIRWQQRTLAGAWRRRRPAPRVA
eukprot:828585-Prymnesium_polylepis.1